MKQMLFGFIGLVCVVSVWAFIVDAVARGDLMEAGVGALFTPYGIFMGLGIITGKW